jgi:hypothetical protein
VDCGFDANASIGHKKPRFVYLSNSKGTLTPSRSGDPAPGSSSLKSRLHISCPTMSDEEEGPEDYDDEHDGGAVVEEVVPDIMQGGNRRLMQQLNPMQQLAAEKKKREEVRAVKEQLTVGHSRSKAPLNLNKLVGGAEKS